MREDVGEQDEAADEAYSVARRCRVAMPLQDVALSSLTRTSTIAGACSVICIFPQPGRGGDFRWCRCATPSENGLQRLNPADTPALSVNARRNKRCTTTTVESGTILPVAMVDEANCKFNKPAGSSGLAAVALPALLDRPCNAQNPSPGVRP